MPIRVEIPVPFSIGSVNAWLWPGSQPTLWDCGIGTKDSYERLRAAMGDTGIDWQGGQLYVSHGHVDHAGNAAWLRRDLGINLHAPRDEAAFIETFQRDSEPRNDRYAEALLLHGMPAERVAEIRGRSDKVDGYTQDTRIDHDVADGTALLLGDTKAHVWRTPGHTPGSIVVHTEDNQLLSGDTLLEHITSNAIELRPEDEGRHHQYVATLEGLRRFEGCEVLPGHHQPFELTAAVLDRHWARYDKRRKLILEGLETPRAAWELMPRIFPMVGPDQHFLAMADLVGHLHALEKDGLVARHEADGVRKFSR